MHPLLRATRPRLLLSATAALLAALSGCGAVNGASGTAATSDAVPPYYAETIAILPPAYANPLNLSIRNTATGDEGAALRALPPYQSIGFVAGTGKPNWWIVGAQRWQVTRTWSGEVSPAVKHFKWGFSLTWLSDNKTLAVGVATGDAMVDSTAAVRYLNTASPGSSLAEANRNVTLSFPAKTAKTGTPDGCYGAPVATSDGQKVLCSGAATYPANAAGATEVGLWVFSARTGTLTAAWNEHTICCALSSTYLPRILWVSPHGTLVIASGMSTDNQGAQLFLRTADGTLQQLPWKGLIHRPNQASITEPSIAW